MNDFLIYDAKAALLIGVFYMFYRLLLARETFHRVNRIVLLLTAVASFLLPLCVITMHETVTMEMPALLTEEPAATAPVQAAQQPATPWWQTALAILFIIGMVATLGRTLWSVIRIKKLIRSCEQHPQADGTTICVTGNADLSPFSWMHYIVMNRHDFEAHDPAILAHERGHIRLRHSWDLLLVDSLTALQWFNPAMWMLRTDLRAIHEYEADAAVLSEGINARQYQYLLITKAAGIGGYSLANGINHSTLKNRINMMLHTKSQRSSMLKLLALLPIVGTALALNAKTETSVVYQTNSSVESMISEAMEMNEPQPNSAVTSDAEVAPAQDEKKGFTATGIVYDYTEKNPSPIVGALVQIVGTKKGTVTDQEGKFKLEVSNGDLLKVSYVGYETGVINVDMKSSEKKDFVVGLYKEKASAPQHDGKVFDVVEEMPQFEGGPSALFEYISRNVRYPKEAKDASEQGRVIATFVVEKDGSVSGTKIVKSVSPSLDAEAVRLISTMPKWKPGKQNGKTVRVKYTIPVTFRVEGMPADDATTAYRAGYEAGKKGLAPSPDNVFYLVDGIEKTFEEIVKLDPNTIDNMKVLKSKEVIEKYGDKAKNGVVVITLKK